MSPNHPIVKALAFYGTRVKHRGQERIHAWLRERLGAQVSTPCEVERQGLRWVLNPTDVAHRGMFWFGEYDRWDFHHFASLAKPGATVIDVGANFGYYSIMLAKKLRFDCRIFAFEPFPSTFELLERHVRMNSLDHVVFPQHAAVSDHVGEAAIHAWNGDEVNSGAATLSAGPDSKGVVLPDAAVVPITTIDAFCETAGLRKLDLIKIDAEGVEEQVLRGATRTISTMQPAVMIELHPRMLSRAGSSPKRLVDMLSGMGYSVHEARRSRLAPLARLPPDGECMNAFALPVAQR